MGGVRGWVEGEEESGGGKERHKRRVNKGEWKT